VFDFAEMREVCEHVLKVGTQELMSPEDEVKVKAEKVDFALCHIESVRERVRRMRDKLAMGGSAEEELETAQEMIREMREMAWGNRLKIREYSCDARHSDENGLS